MKMKHEKIIDLHFGAHILETDRKEAKKMILYMLESFYRMDKTQLQIAHAKKNWQDMGFIVDKLMGGLFFCGTPRLRHTVICLNTLLKKKQFKLAEILYRRFLNEFDVVKQSLATMPGGEMEI